MVIKKKRNRKLCFTYADIAALRGVTSYAVRRAVCRGVFDPKDIISISEYIKGGRKKKTKISHLKETGHKSIINNRIRNNQWDGWE